MITVGRVQLKNVARIESANESNVVYFVENTNQIVLDGVVYSRTYSDATTSTSGLLSGSDKSKLNKIDNSILKVVSIDKTNCVCAAGSTGQFSQGWTAPSGYTFVSMLHGTRVDVNGTTSPAYAEYVNVVNFWTSGTTAYWVIKNFGSGQAKVSLHLQVLYIKTF